MMVISWLIDVASLKKFKEYLIKGFADKYWDNHRISAKIIIFLAEIIGLYLCSTVQSKTGDDFVKRIK